MLIRDVASVGDLEAVMRAPFISADPAKPAANPADFRVQESFAYWSRCVSEFAATQNEGIEFLIALNELNNLSRTADREADVEAKAKAIADVKVKTKAIIDKFIVTKPFPEGVIRDPSNTPINITDATVGQITAAYSSAVSEAEILGVVQLLNGEPVEAMFAVEVVAHFTPYVLKAPLFEIDPATGRIITDRMGNPSPIEGTEGKRLQSDREGIFLVEMFRSYLRPSDVDGTEPPTFWIDKVRSYAKEGERSGKDVDRRISRNIVMLSQLHALAKLAAKAEPDYPDLDSKVQKFFRDNLSKTALNSPDLSHLSVDRIDRLREDYDKMPKPFTEDGCKEILRRCRKIIVPDTLRVLHQSGFLSRYTQSEKFKSDNAEFQEVLVKFTEKVAKGAGAGRERSVATDMGSGAPTRSRSGHPGSSTPVSEDDGQDWDDLLDDIEALEKLERELADRARELGEPLPPIPEEGGSVDSGLAESHFDHDKKHSDKKEEHHGSAK